jgi:hypothetical protein
MMKLRWLVGLFLLTFIAPFATAQDQMEEIVVTGMRKGDGAEMPGTFLRKTGDYVLLGVAVTNDTREEKARKEEIYATLRAALAAAKRDGSIELSVVDDNELVIPLKVDSATVVLQKGDRPDTSATRISVKTKIPSQNANGQALISKLKDFVSNIKAEGRTKLDPDGDIDISIVGPNRYRDEIILLYAADAKKITSALGEDYKIVTTGIDRPVKWVRMGLLELALFIPYKFDVLPSTVTAFTSAPAE